MPASPGVLQITSESTDFGSVAVGATATQSFTITNTGGTKVTIFKSKPPFGGEFAATTSLTEGSTIAPGASVVEQVRFTPTPPGPANGVWLINGNDSTGLHQVTFSGTGAGSAVPAAATTPPRRRRRPARPRNKLGSPKLTPSVLTLATIGKATFSYVAAAAGTTKFTLQRQVTGRRAGGRCVATTARNRNHAHCVRYVDVVSFVRTDHVGVNSVHLSTFINIRKLVPGTYRVKAAPEDTQGAGAIYGRFQLSLARHAKRATNAALLTAARRDSSVA